MKSADDDMTFGAHLEVLRQMLMRILAVACALAIIVFCCKDLTWSVLLAPSHHDFCMYRLLESVAHVVGFPDFSFQPYNVQLITTELSSQFMLHVSTAMYLGLLGASPFIVYELFRFISPALYESERRYSVPVAIVVYIMFLVGILMTYFLLFPISFRFLGTYQVSEQVHATITLDSYIDTFLTLSLLMGVVFQLPVLAFVLGKMHLVTSTMLSRFRKHSFLLILIVSAVITPPDIMTLLLVSVPLYLLYEVSIQIVRHNEKR